MPQVILHISSTLSETNRADLVTAVRAVIPRVLGIEEHIGQVLLYETPASHRATHVSRDPRFVIVEVMMYPGRTAEMKAALMQAIVVLITQHIGVKAKDINCIIHEIPPTNYFGGTSHRYIDKLTDAKRDPK